MHNITSFNNMQREEQQAVPASVNFRWLRQQVSMRDVLAHYGLLEKLQAEGKSLRGTCPVHNGTNPHQFVVTPPNRWKCFGDCVSHPALNNGGGNQIDFVRVMENIATGDIGQDTYRAALKMYEWFNLREVPLQDPTVHAAAAIAQDEPEAFEDEEVVNPPLAARGFSGFRSLDHNHPYLVERGLLEETVEYFGVGFHGGKGMMAHRVVIPIHNADGELVAYAGRWPGNPPEDTPKYLLPPRFCKQLEVFNLHRVPATKHVVLVEGYFDVMRLHQCGWPNTVATMGVSISKRQVELVASKFRGVHILFDGDETGRKAGKTVAAELGEHVWVRVAHCPEGTQPEHLSEAQLRDILR